VRRALFFLLFLSYAYFYQAGGWNQNSRFALVRAIANDRTVRIDPYEGNTGDKAFFDGHYYSDKAPGLAFAALPIVEPAHRIYRAFGGDPETFAGLALLSYLATVFTVGLLTAWAGVALFDVSRALGASPAGALFAATTFGLATPMWPLATIFIGHAISAACLVLAFAAAVRVDLEHGRAHRWPVTQSAITEYRDRLNGWAIGLGAGWATISEFPAAVPAVMLAAWALWSAVRLGPRRAFIILSSMTAGALACAGLLMAYQYVCFGSPFHLAYSSEAGFEGMQQGLFGITTPSMAALWRITIGEYRGLLPLSPIVALAPFGLRLYRSDRRASVVAGAIALFYVLLNASYHYWEGGWSLGPRHLSPALPFLCLGLAPLWSAAGRLGRCTLVTLWLISAGLTLVGVATMPQPPSNIERPMRDLLWPSFRDGTLSLNTQTFAHIATDPSRWRTRQDPPAAFNLGMKMGLDGHVSLLPLAIVWLLCGGWLWRVMPRAQCTVVGSSHH
jgi:hypothetical protein